jgi:putative transposase
VQDLCELRQLREENNRLKRLVTDLALDRNILQEIVSKSCEAASAMPVGAVGIWAACPQSIRRWMDQGAR